MTGDMQQRYMDAAEDLERFIEQTGQSQLQPYQREFLRKALQQYHLEPTPSFSVDVPDNIKDLRDTYQVYQRGVRHMEVSGDAFNATTFADSVIIKLHDLEPSAHLSNMMMAFLWATVYAHREKMQNINFELLGEVHRAIRGRMRDPENTSMRSIANNNNLAKITDACNIWAGMDRPMSQVINFGEWVCIV